MNGNQLSAKTKVGGKRLFSERSDDSDLSDSEEKEEEDKTNQVRLTLAEYRFSDFM